MKQNMGGKTDSLSRMFFLVAEKADGILNREISHFPTERKIKNDSPTLNMSHSFGNETTGVMV